MKAKFKSSLPLAIAAGTLALAAGGCTTFDNMRDRMSDRSSDRSASRSVERSSTPGTTGSATTGRSMSGSSGSSMSGSPTTGSSMSGASRSTPPSVDPFSSSYISFPASDNESAGPIGMSNFCRQHYSQPGCQTNGVAANEGSRSSFMGRDSSTRRSDARDQRHERSSEAATPNRN